ncbi:Txe/YoeB family addiction module toxin [Runella sp.]|uniref:Txe/YoeB family addiction module toxin n=1 Tax=Runella sp. TaxID=1960881 RepID=UPI003D0AA64F
MSWINENKKIFLKISELIEETRRHPFEGKGKPEALKHDFKGFWSRRITDGHRMIYKVTNEAIEFYSFRDHYGDK